jgi:hypothetical protein
MSVQPRMIVILLTCDRVSNTGLRLLLWRERDNGENMSVKPRMIVILLTCDRVGNAGLRLLLWRDT